MCRNKGDSELSRTNRLLMTVTVIACGAFSVGHYAGSAGSAEQVGDCKAAVVAALDDYRDAPGAFERFTDYAGRCV